MTMTSLTSIERILNWSQGHLWSPEEGVWERVTWDRIMSVRSMVTLTQVDSIA